MSLIIMKVLLACTSVVHSPKPLQRDFRSLGWIASSPSHLQYLVGVTEHLLHFSVAAQTGLERLFVWAPLTRTTNTPHISILRLNPKFALKQPCLVQWAQKNVGNTFLLWGPSANWFKDRPTPQPCGTSKASTFPPCGHTLSTVIAKELATYGAYSCYCKSHRCWAFLYDSKPTFFWYALPPWFKPVPVQIWSWVLKPLRCSKMFTDIIANENSFSRPALNCVLNTTL